MSGKSNNIWGEIAQLYLIKFEKLLPIGLTAGLFQHIYKHNNFYSTGNTVESWRIGQITQSDGGGNKFDSCKKITTELGIFGRMTNCDDLSESYEYRLNPIIDHDNGEYKGYSQLRFLYNLNGEFGKAKKLHQFLTDINASVKKYINSLR